LNKHKNSTWYQSSVPEEAIAQASLAPFMLVVTFLLQLQKLQPLPFFLVKLVLALSLGRWA
jgi:hypothetical protein